MGFLESLAAAKAKVADRVKTPPVPAVVDGKYYEVVFYRCSSSEWSAVTVQNPPREGVALDMRNGYNISGVARAISVSSGRVLEGGVEQELTAEQWADLWEVIPPATARLIEANVWSLHEFDTEREIAAAKKASQRRSRKKSS